MAKQTEPKSSGKGSLIIIGGREDKEKDMKILCSLADRIPKRGKLVIATVASSMGDELWEQYRSVFKKLGVKRISHLSMVDRTKAQDTRALRAVQGADAVFFTGGDL